MKTLSEHHFQLEPLLESQMEAGPDGDEYIKMKETFSQSNFRKEREHKRQPHAPKNYQSGASPTQMKY